MNQHEFNLQDGLYCCCEEENNMQTAKTTSILIFIKLFSVYTCEYSFINPITKWQLNHFKLLRIVILKQHGHDKTELINLPFLFEYSFTNPITKMAA